MTPEEQDAVQGLVEAFLSVVEVYLERLGQLEQFRAFRDRPDIAAVWQRSIERDRASLHTAWKEAAALAAELGVPLKEPPTH